VETRAIDLRTTAIAEAARLAAARRVPRGGDEAAREWLASRRPWIARARSGRRRSALHGKTLLVWQVAAEDGCGSPVAASLVAMIVDVDVSARWRSRRVEDAIMQIDCRVPATLAGVLRERADRMVAAARAFAEARLVRERAVAARASERARSPQFQPGLFDRRAERARQLALVATLEADETMNGRVAAAAAAAAISPASPTLLLVLTA